MDISLITHLPRLGSSVRRLGGEAGECGVENLQGGSPVGIPVQASVDDGSDVRR